MSFEGGNRKICSFKLSFSTVFYLPQALHWFCYNTVISKRESLLQTSLSCSHLRYDLLVAVAGGCYRIHFVGKVLLLTLIAL